MEGLPGSGEGVFAYSRGENDMCMYSSCTHLLRVDSCTCTVLTTGATETRYALRSQGE